MCRPCFALSVMLCCLAGPLLIIGKTHAQVTVVSPSHDPGECIVCPLARGPLGPCGGYSDYDYNRYWRDECSSPASEATTSAELGLEADESLPAGPTEEAWESGYDDYYADYVYGDDAPCTDAEDLTLDGTPAATALIDVASETAPASVVPPSEATSEQYDEYGWYSEAPTVAGDYVQSTDGFESVVPAKPETAPRDEVTPAETAIDYDAYEEEWFSYGSETTAEALPKAAADLESTEPLETGYDEDYDGAMATDQEARVDDYESYYDANDDWYNFDSASTGPFTPETGETTVVPAGEEHAQQALDSEPAWLTELVDRMLTPVRTAANDVDECAQDWDCEAEYWAQPQPKQPSVVLRAADTLDELALLLQNAAELLRGGTSGHLAETAQTTTAESSR